MQYIIIKNPNAKKPKYFAAEDWTDNRDEAVRFESQAKAMSVIKGLISKTASWEVA